jgi:hypothetical protein
MKKKGSRLYPSTLSEMLFRKTFVWAAIEGAFMEYHHVKLGLFNMMIE